MDKNQNVGLPFSKQQYIALGAAVLIILAIAGYAFYRSTRTSSTSTATSTASTEATSTGNLSTLEKEGKVKVTLVPSISVPDLNRISPPPQNDPNLPPETITLIDAQIASTSAYLKKNNIDVNTWIDLGIYRKMLEDYQGTLAAWNYALALDPGYSVTLGDIADLYANFLNQPGVAVSYYQKAIAANPTAGNLYQGLYETYRYKLNDLPDAKITLQKAIAVQADGYQYFQTMLNNLPQQ